MSVLSPLTSRSARLRRDGSVLIYSPMPLRTTAIATPTDRSSSKSIFSFTSWWSNVIIITFFQMKVDLFDDVLALLVLLAGLIRFFVCPSDQAFASFAEDIAHAVQACNEKSILSWPDTHIDTVVKEVCPPWMSSNSCREKRQARTIIRRPLSTYHGAHESFLRWYHHDSWGAFDTQHMCKSEARPSKQGNRWVFSPTWIVPLLML